MPRSTQADLDAWIKEYNEARPHQGYWCFGKTPTATARTEEAHDKH
jgi:hypothetical protein